MPQGAKNSADHPAIIAENLTFSWAKGAGQPTVHIPHLAIARGEKVFLRGPSGSGKSTLLGLICGVLSPGSGTLCVAGEDMTALSAARRDALRAREFGVIFQLFNLVPYLSVIANVTLPCAFSPQRAARARKHQTAHRKGGEASNSLTDEARRLLTRLGLGDDILAKNTVQELSVGQQQRVAAARALIGAPQLVVADEPTSALDADARDAFVALLIEECAANDTTLVFVSHDAALGSHFDRVIDLAQINKPASSEMTQTQVAQAATTQT